VTFTDNTVRCWCPKSTFALACLASYGYYPSFP